MPVPVAESQLNLKTAGSGFSFFSTTGTSRKTLWSRKGIEISFDVIPAIVFGRSHHFSWSSCDGFLETFASICFGVKPPSRNVRTCGNPHIKTQRLRKTQGTQAEIICLVV